MIDIDTLDLKGLAQLRARIDERVKVLKESSVPELLTRFADEAAAVGLSLDEVLGKKRRGRPRATPDPDGSSELA